ncbi:hypothetical protein NST54_02730 [Caldifermentibacillus hisashii]
MNNNILAKVERKQELLTRKTIYFIKHILTRAVPKINIGGARL